jgi:hypothetical protein
MIDQKTVQQTVEETNFFIKHFSDITSLIEVILVGIYVYYTIKTFNQIKKQTDLQLKAYLNADNFLSDEKDFAGKDFSKTELDRNFSNDWKEIMVKSFPALSGSGSLDGGYYCLSLTNYGNTEIKSIKICCEIKILNSNDSVEKKKLIREDNKVFETEIKQILKKGENVIFPLFSTASFPIYSIQTTGKYLDVRNQEYPIEKLNLLGENKHLQ